VTSYRTKGGRHEVLSNLPGAGVLFHERTVELELGGRPASSTQAPPPDSPPAPREHLVVRIVRSG
jgi:hypothetical protein